MEEAFSLSESQRSLYCPLIFLVSFTVIVGNNRPSIHTGGNPRLLIAKILADPHIQQPLERRKSIICSLVCLARFSYFLGCYVRKLTNFAHKLCCAQQPGKLVPEEITTESVLHLPHITTDE